jgi:hypothetical protein
VTTGELSESFSGVVQRAPCVPGNMDRAAGVRRLLFIAALFICAALIASLAIYQAFHVPVGGNAFSLFYVD